MKNVRMMLSAAVVLAIVGSALAFKPLGAGSVYCQDNGTTCSDLRNFKVDDNGSTTDVCNGQEYVFNGSDCIPTSSSAKFTATPVGN